MKTREISPKISEIPNAALTLKTMAEAFIPALDDAADYRNEEGQRRRALDLRELANLWIEISQLADDMDGKQKILPIAS